MSEEGKSRMRMSGEEVRKGIVGVPEAKPSSDDRKEPSIANNVVLKSTDMKENMLEDSINIAIAASEECSVEKDVAEYIKKKFDKKYGPTWHCIVGSNFGSYVTHETGNFSYFYLGKKAVLLFKSG